MKDERLFNPCAVCWSRYGRSYTSECDKSCTYAMDTTMFKAALRRKDTYIQELEKKLQETQDLLNRAYRIVGQVIEKPNPFVEE